MTFRRVQIRYYTFWFHTIQKRSKLLIRSELNKLFMIFWMRKELIKKLIQFLTSFNSLNIMKSFIFGFTDSSKFDCTSDPKIMTILIILILLSTHRFAWAENRPDREVVLQEVETVLIQALLRMVFRALGDGVAELPSTMPEAIQRPVHWTSSACRRRFRHLDGPVQQRPAVPFGMPNCAGPCWSTRPASKVQSSFLSSFFG